LKQGLTVTLDALAQLGYRPPGGWMLACEAALLRALPLLRPTGVAQVVAALAALGFRPQVGAWVCSLQPLHHGPCCLLRS